MSIYKRNINVNDGNDNHTIYKQQHEKSITNQTKNDSLPSSSSSSPSSFILRNPQSLLSHDPNQLCRLLNLNLQQVLSLRDEISKTIVLDDTIGNSTSLISYYDNDNNNNNVDNNNNNNDNNNITCDIQMKNQYKRKRIMNGLIHGSMTAKELYQLSFLSSSSTAASSSSSLILSSSTSSTSQNNIIQTGSQVLDILLSIRNNNNDDDNNNDDGDNIDNINKRQRLHSSSSAITNTTSNNNDNKYGIEIGTITEICGISSSGKTQLVLSIAAETIVSNYINNNSSSRSSNTKNFKVHYIAGGGGSTSLISLARRFRQLCRSKLNIALGNNNNINNSTSMNQNHDDVLNRIKFIPVGDNPYYLLAELNHIENEMKKNISAAVSATTTTIEDNSNNILLIIDSISGCLSSYLYADGDGGLGAGIMNEISLILRRLSRMTTVVHTSKNNEKSMDNDVVVMNQCTVLITNGMVMDGNSNNTRMHKPALGESWRAADVRLILERVQNLYEEDDNQQQQVSSSRSRLRNNGNRLRISTSTIVNARLEKHFSKSCFPPKAITFAIDTSGVLDVKK